MESLLWNYIVRGEQASCGGAGIDHLVHVHSCIHAVVVGVWRHSMALDTSVEASIGFLALVNQLLGLLGMSQVVVSYLTKIIVSNLLLEIIS